MFVVQKQRWVVHVSHQAQLGAIAQQWSAVERASHRMDLSFGEYLLREWCEAMALACVGTRTGFRHVVAPGHPSVGSGGPPYPRISKNKRWQDIVTVVDKVNYSSRKNLNKQTSRSVMINHNANILQYKYLQTRHFTEMLYSILINLTWL